MNTTWLKIASGAIGVLIVIVLVSMFMPSGDNQPAQTQTNQEGNPPTNFYQQAEKDKKDLLVTPEEEEAIASQTPDNNVEQPGEPGQTTNNVTPPPAESQPVPTQPQPTEITIYVKQLTNLEKTEAERELNYAVPMFSIGRLPTTSYKPAIDSVRRIINRWPDSIYAYNAKLLLAKIPPRYYQQYDITAEELDTSKFMKPRVGTVPVQVPIEEQ